MVFSEKLNQAMQQLKINQAQLVGLTGIGKSSISQYLSGKNIPSEERQKNIAVSLGLEAGYFTEKEEPIIKLLKQGGGCAIQEIRPVDVGKLMHMNHQTVEKGLIQGVFPWGYAIQTSPNRHRYFINAKRFAEIEGVEVPPEMVVV